MPAALRTPALPTSKDICCCRSIVEALIASVDTAVVALEASSWTGATCCLHVPLRSKVQAGAQHLPTTKVKGGTALSKPTFWEGILGSLGLLG